MLAVVLDPTCGARSMWFDKTDSRAVFTDRRREVITLCDGRVVHVAPEITADFTDLPFPDESFRLVVFDPPHLINCGRRGWLAQKYGRLVASWEDEIQAGFEECFRVLRPEGVLIFKWSEVQIPLFRILALTDQRPLFGYTGTAPTTYWMTFMKESKHD